jgi:GTP-binding protein Era
MAEKLKKSGLAVLVGRSNVGKSTLLNSLVGTKVAITTPKPQTTRHIIQGVVHDPRGQVVFVDTPGIFTRVPDTLTAKLNEKAKDALDGIDVLLYVVDPTRHVGDEEKAVHRLVRNATVPKILVINKSDLKGPYADEYRAWDEEFDEVIEISALNRGNLKALVDMIFGFLKDGEPLYPPDQITGVENRFWLEELFREKVFMKMHEEIPYTTAAQVHEVTTRDNGIIYVRATIITTAPRYKKMLIGAGARTIKDIGRAVRKELEEVSGKKYFIDLDVQVEERWQERFE